MNILLINHYAGSPRHGMEYRPFYLSREWIRSGHTVTIVAAAYSHVRHTQPAVTVNMEEEIEGIRYIWIKAPRYHGNGYKRILNMLFFVFQLFALRGKLTKDFCPDIVIASSTYPLDIYPAYYIARKYRAKLIFEVHDLWPLSPMELGGMSKWNPFIVIMQMAENFAYRTSDKIVSILPKTREYLVKHGMRSDKFMHIPNGIDVSGIISSTENDDIPPVHKEAIRTLKSKGRFIVGYGGAHGLANALGIIIDAAVLLQNQPVTFVLVGDGPEKRNLENKVKSYAITNVIFLPPLRKSQVLSILNDMDVLYIGLKKQQLFRFGVSPNKLMDYMMAGKPIIYAIEAGNNMVEECQCGISIPSEEPHALSEAVIKMMSLSAEERHIIGSRGREYVKAHHDYNSLAQTFIDVMKN